MIIEEYCIEIITHRKNICEVPVIAYTIQCTCTKTCDKIHVLKPVIKYLTKAKLGAKLWNVVKYYSQNCQLNILLHVCKTTCETETGVC